MKDQYDNLFNSTTGTNQTITIMTITCEGCGIPFWDMFAESWPKCEDCREKYWRRKLPHWYERH